MRCRHYGVAVMPAPVVKIVALINSLSDPVGNLIIRHNISHSFFSFKMSHGLSGEHLWARRV